MRIGYAEDAAMRRRSNFIVCHPPDTILPKAPGMPEASFQSAVCWALHAAYGRSLSALAEIGGLWFLSRFPRMGRARLAERS